MALSVSFRKYHGLGNDFILVDNRQSNKPCMTPEDAIRVCDRNKGVGADGLIFLLPPISPGSDAQMRLYNSDGSEPEMCGNGIRCLAKFAADLGVHTSEPGKIVLDTLGGVIIPELVTSSPTDVKVDMGPPILNPSDVPTLLSTSAENSFSDRISSIAGRDWEVTAVSMGNPHCLTFVDESTYSFMDDNLEKFGPDFESHKVFPARTNTEFIYMRSRTEMDMLVWERGAGRTKACGTGACAAVVAAVLTNRADKDSSVTVHLPGGDLMIEWSSATNHVFMTGPAELVFTGQLHMS